MYNENYMQVERVDPSQNSSVLKIAGTLCEIASLAFLICAFYVSYLMFIGFGILVAIGFIMIFLYNRKPSSFMYAIDSSVLVVSKQDMVKKQSRIAQIAFTDIEDYSAFQDFVNHKKDIVAAPNIHAMNVKQIVYTELGEKKRLLFTPDTYLDSLIKMQLKDREL